MADQVGRVLGGRYRLVAPIGTGASAHVYVADDITLRRRVAVKVLHAALAGDESFLRRFRAEAQAVAALRHPNIMSVHDWGEDHDGPFLVMEYLGGGSLRDLLDRGQRLTLSQALLVGLEAARALDYAHRRGLVHRDIKPANLLFDEEGRLAIADFGLARALAEAAWTEPAGAVLGTARYASPEQAQGASVDGKSDVYALAIVLVEAVTGQAPFAADTTIGTLMARVDRPLTVPESLGPLVPVLEAAGAAGPTQRLDAGSLARRFDEVARELPRPEPIPVASVGRPDIPAPSPGDLTELPAPSRRVYDIEADERGGGDDLDLPPVRRRRRWPKLALLLVLALLASGGAAWAIVQAAVPSHAVPAGLRARTVEQARAEVADEKFQVRVTGEVFDEDVEAGRIVDQDPSSGTLKEGQSIRVVVSKGPRPRAVPSLEGRSRAEAEQLLVAEKFVPVFRTDYSDTVAVDGVISWSPKEGDQPRGSEVQVIVSAGKKPVKLPSLAEKALDEAKSVLEGLGLVVRTEEVFSEDVAAGKVVATRPPNGDEAAVGSEVVLRISKGPEQVAVPNVIGRSFDEAKQLLEQAGLQVQGPFGPPSKRRVFATDPAPGTRVRKGTPVDVFVS